MSFDSYQQIINTPDLLVGIKSLSHYWSHFMVRWETPELFSTVKAMADKMPHLKQLVVLFFHGAKETWKRFTSSSHLVELLMKHT